MKQYFAGGEIQERVNSLAGHIVFVPVFVVCSVVAGTVAGTVAAAGVDLFVEDVETVYLLSSAVYVAVHLLVHSNK